LPFLWHRIKALNVLRRAADSFLSWQPKNACVSKERALLNQYGNNVPRAQNRVLANVQKHGAHPFKTGRKAALPENFYFYL
jgi:hypothetical protein